MDARRDLAAPTMRPAGFALLLGAFATCAALTPSNEPSSRPKGSTGRAETGDRGRATPADFAGPVAIAAAAEPITGRASYYGEEYRGRTMANGRPFDPGAMTAASRDFPLGSCVRVSHGARSVVVTITDRGPARTLRQRGCVIDLSRAAFESLATTAGGLIVVTITREAPRCRLMMLRHHLFPFPPSNP